MSEGRGVALAILGIVALIAVVGLVLLFSGRLTAQVVAGEPVYGLNKLYGRAPGEQVIGSSDNPNSGSWVTGTPYTWEGQVKSVVGGSQADYRVPSEQTKGCPRGLDRMGRDELATLSDEEAATCIASPVGDGSFCCRTNGLQVFGGQNNV